MPESLIHLNEEFIERMLNSIQAKIDKKESTVEDTQKALSIAKELLNICITQKYKHY